MRVIAVIPSRLASIRLPNKVLADICGKPLVQHVWERVRRVKNLDEIIVATDSDIVVGVVTAFGGHAFLTDPACQSGTERIASIVNQLDADLILNIQGDEPLVDPVMIEGLINTLINFRCDIITPVYRITHQDDINNPNIVKVARAYDGRALYFSRSTIPYVRDRPKESWLEFHEFWGHIGVYGYQKNVLADYANLPMSSLQQAESLEQLQFLEAGYTIQTMETSYHSLAVDTHEDLERVRELMSR